MELHNCRIKFLFALLLILNLSMAKFCIAASNALFPNQTLVDGQTLISPNQMFKMGFFSPGSSTHHKFLGIWYTNTPDVVVWVANRNHPVTDFNDLHLAMDGTGNLSITSHGGVVWSQNASLKKPILRLLDTGNLVLADEEGLESVSWQSFDHPTDTLLPGMKLVDTNGAGVDKFLTSWRNSDDPSQGDYLLRIDNNGLPELVLYKGIKKLFRTGAWNGLHFSGTAPTPKTYGMPEEDIKDGMVFKDEKLVSIVYNGSQFSRLVVEKSGSVNSVNMNSMKDEWDSVEKLPSEPCEEYNYCGPFGKCIPGFMADCQCLSGLSPKSQKDWDRYKWSDGCTRRIPLTCEDHKFIEVAGIKYPDMLDFWLNSSMNIYECRALCLTKCDCIAYANPYITNGGTGCLMWFGELIDIKQVSGAHEEQKIFIRLPNLEQGSSISKEVEEKSTPMIFILLSIISGIIISNFINGAAHYYLARHVKQDNAVRTADEDLDTTQYKLSVIMAATCEFSKENLIGEGGFGPVYKGILSAQQQIAVKRLSGKSKQGIVEFKNEVMLIAKLQHRNLVKLLGCCIEGGERILIYEYMQNKSLDTFVFDQNRRMLLPWPERFNIIMRIARGLLYLHHDSRLKIIHRDLKANNILLDGNLNPKISDFGLARISEDGQLGARTTKVAGTYGYMSPEYATEGKFSTKSDIFSLGVMLLEIVSGKKNRPLISCQCLSLLEHAWLLWKENDSLMLIDECLKNAVVETQAKRCVQIGLLCVQRYAEDRPDMISVYSMLSTNEGVLPDPKEPGFFFERNSPVANHDASMGIQFENATVSVSDLEAR